VIWQNQCSCLSAQIYANQSGDCRLVVFGVSFDSRVVSSLTYHFHLHPLKFSISTVYLVITGAMLLAFWNLSRLTARSSTTFLRGRSFHACVVDHRISSKEEPVKYREALERENAATRLQRLENLIEYKRRKRSYNEKYLYSREKPEAAKNRIRSPDTIEKEKQRRSQLPFRQGQALRKIILNRPEIWSHLTWKTHRPVLYDTKTKHECASCYKNPYLGYRLWWKRHDNSDHSPDHSPGLYDCHACFVADWSRAVPIGYEDFVFGQGNRFQLRDTAGSVETPSHFKEK
jgi:hypothetical protein